MEEVQKIIEQLKNDITIVVNEFVKGAITEKYTFYKNGEKVSKTELKELLDNFDFAKQIANIVDVNVHIGLFMEIRVCKVGGVFEFKEDVYKFETEEEKGALLDLASLD